MHLTSLVSPIPGADPGGIDLTFLPEFDAIQQARQGDDPSLDQGEWARTLKTADWPLVSRRSGCTGAAERSQWLAGSFLPGKGIDVGH